MLDGIYALTVDSPLGKKNGTVKISTNGSRAEADIDAPIVGKQHVIGTAQGDSFTARGSMKIFLVGTIDYEVNGQVEGDIIKMFLHTSKGDINLEGVRV